MPGRKLTAAPVSPLISAVLVFVAPLLLLNGCSLSDEAIEHEALFTEIVISDGARAYLSPEESKYWAWLEAIQSRLKRTVEDGRAGPDFSATLEALRHMNIETQQVRSPPTFKELHAHLTKKLQTYPQLFTTLSEIYRKWDSQVASPIIRDVGKQKDRKDQGKAVLNWSAENQLMPEIKRQTANWYHSHLVPINSEQDLIMKQLIHEFQLRRLWSPLTKK